MSLATTTVGFERPAPGIWRVDPGHAEVAFIGRHFGLTKIRGRFIGVDATVTLAEDVTASHLEVIIDMASVTSGYDERDNHLRSPDFFDVTSHPTATFRSTAVVDRGAGGHVTGNLTIRSVARPVILAVEYLGAVADPSGNDRAIFSASTTINREDWGLTWNVPLAAGGLLVSKEIRIEIEAEVVRQPS